MSLKELVRDAGVAWGMLAGKPFQVLLQVTNRCNMKCDFCAFWPNGVPPRDELSLDDYRRIEAELAARGTCMISIEGGEPMVRPDLVEIVRLFGRHHLPILFTNGWYVDRDKARALFDAGLAQVGVSIDYPDAARHDRRRVVDGAFERAWAAVDQLRDAAPHGGRQVHVMTVLMQETIDDLEALLQLSKARGVGHCLTLVSTAGFRRGEGGTPPPAGVSARLMDLWERYPHLRIFRDYLEGMDPFLRGDAMPACHAGQQSFNIDHVGNVAPCIEKIDRTVGNVRTAPFGELLAALAVHPEVPGCRQCWTACRGFVQAMGGGGSWRAWRDLAGRMRSV